MRKEKINDGLFFVFKAVPVGKVALQSSAGRVVNKKIYKPLRQLKLPALHTLCTIFLSAKAQRTIVCRGAF